MPDCCGNSAHLRAAERWRERLPNAGTHLSSENTAVADRLTWHTQMNLPSSPSLVWLKLFPKHAQSIIYYYSSASVCKKPGPITGTEH